MMQQYYDNGVMWDALDKSMNNPDASKRRSGNVNIIINDIIDKCFLNDNNTNFNNMSPIFNQLNSNVDSPVVALKNVLKSVYASDQEKKEAIIELFESYGY